MNERLEILYNTNIELLKSIIGCSINSATQEEYFFEGELDTESMGTLKLFFSNEQELTFDCDGDSESLSVRKIGFSDKRTLETDFEDNRYKWKEKEFLGSDKLAHFGKITNIYFEELTNEFSTIQSGCKIEFESGGHLFIWTIESDNIFYGINEIPPCQSNTELNIELKEIKTLYNNMYKT